MVRFDLDGLEVFFPYPYVYPEQYAYMRQLKAGLDAKGHCVLEMPTGTGKTVALFSLITSYQMAHREQEKFFFCTRTVAEMEKALIELRGVLRYRSEELTKDQDHDRLARSRCLGVALSARRNLCVHPRVLKETDRDKIDEKCRCLTAPWVRRREQELIDSIKDIEELNAETGCPLCPWYESLERHWTPESIPPDIYTIDELRQFGATGKNPIPPQESSHYSTATIPGPDVRNKKKFCPYFAARRLLPSAKIVILNYQYVLDPKVAQIALGSAGLLSSKSQIMGGGNRFLKSDTEAVVKEPSCIVFDEAHNIDNVCIEALSINITVLDLERSRQNIRKLSDIVNNARLVDRDKLMFEYRKIVQEIHGGEDRSGGYESFLEEHLASPLLPSEQKLLESSMPGNIRRAELFVLNLQKVLSYLEVYIRQFQVVSEGPLSFLRNLQDKLKIDVSSLKFFYERLKNLFLVLQITNLEEFLPLTKICDFCTLVANYWKGFIIIIDPYPDAPGIYDPIIQLCCLDSSLAMKPVIDRYQSLVLTSGTISPLNLYPKLLGFTPVITQSFPMSLDRKCILPMIVGKGPDQIPLSSKFELREDMSVIRNYGRLIIEFAKIVPDGLVCFFTSYAYMESVISKWYSTGVLAEVMKYKLILMETKDIVSTTLALDNYRKCCDSGRGAIFLSVARGKVSEGIDFDRHYGRCVILFGIPYQYTLSRILKARLEYIKDQFNINEYEYLSFDAIRQSAQCLGRVIRSKADYALMIFADYRYSRPDKKFKIPQWILEHLEHLNLSVDHAVILAKRFLLQMSQPYTLTMKSRLDKTALMRLAQLAQQQGATQLAQQQAEQPSPPHPPKQDSQRGLNEAPTGGQGAKANPEATAASAPQPAAASTEATGVAGLPADVVVEATATTVAGLPADVAVEGTATGVTGVPSDNVVGLPVDGVVGAPSDTMADSVAGVPGDKTDAGAEQRPVHHASTPASTGTL